MFGLMPIDRLWSDHNPIFLILQKLFLVHSFKLYNSWLLRDGFDNLIKEEWELLDSNLKCHEKKLQKIDISLLQWILSKAVIHVNWDIEGDETSKFFIGSHKPKSRRQSDDQWDYVDGNCDLEPLFGSRIASVNFYKRKFQISDSQVMFSNLPHSHSLNCMDRETLERQVTLEEIKEAVWDCGSSKAPGPDVLFGNKWCSWIKACLNSSRASILINGSPTSEFSIKRGLRQGDPLSPFLFILVMEGLHNAFEEAVGKWFDYCVKIMILTINVSLLFYADDRDHY
ncbi:RNA-directed DNA polymerase, eukaryota, reverse transcriptase zinc-binding domain protein [Tanacetum coccineum]